MKNVSLTIKGLSTDFANLGLKVDAFLDKTGLFTEEKTLIASIVLNIISILIVATMLSMTVVYYTTAPTGLDPNYVVEGHKAVQTTLVPENFAANLERMVDSFATEAEIDALAEAGYTIEAVEAGFQTTLDGKTLYVPINETYETLYMNIRLLIEQLAE